MLEPQDIRPDEAAGRMAAAFRKVNIPVGPQPAVVAKVVAARDTAPIMLRKEKVIMLKRITRIAAVLAVGALVAGSVWLWLGRGATVTFADVVQQLLAVRTATFDVTAQMPGQPAQKSHVMYMHPGRERVVIGDSIMIHDQQSGRMMTLIPAMKRAMVVHAVNVPEDRKQAANKDSLDELVKHFQAALQGKESTYAPLGEGEVEGRRVVGFRVVSPMQEIVAWVDPQTGLPVQMQSQMKVFGRSTVLMDSFAFNVELDESLFDLNPPAGYSVQTQELDMSPPTEEDLVTMLRVFAQRTGGGFPVEVAMGPKLAAQLKATKQPHQASDPDARQKQAAEFMAQFMRGIIFAQKLPEESHWHYAGAGVKLNTPNTPIFWYRPKDATLYRVIYADLSVREMPPSEIPTTQPATQPAEVTRP